MAGILELAGRNLTAQRRSIQSSEGLTAAERNNRAERERAQVFLVLGYDTNGTIPAVATKISWLIS